MNPITVNSTNIVSFGFKATFDILNRQIRFDITGLTVFNTGGAAAVKGVNFEVIDPSGVKISTIDFPTKDIDTAATSTFNLPIPGDDSIFGTWQIKGVISEANDTLYTATIPPKEICKPVGLDNDVVPGILLIKTNCAIPYIQVTERTNLSYKNISPLSLVKNGVLYAPRGTVADLAFTSTPIQVASLYTGEYTAILRTIATYDLGDNAFIEVVYDSEVKENVTCKDRLCDISCCIQDTYTEYMENCNNAKGKAAQDKLEKITVPLFVAQSKERCGKDASAEIKIIKDILNCDCNCAGQKVESAPIQIGGGNAIVLDGECATEIGEAVIEGDTITYPIKTKFVTFGKKDVGDLAFIIDTINDNCSTNYRIGWDYDILGNSLLLAIQNQVSHANQDLLNSLIYSTGGGSILTGLDGKCIIDLTKCDYLFSGELKSAGKIVKIIIDSIVYVAPGSGISVTNDAGLLSWLNGLGKGAFTVVAVSAIGNTTLTVQSLVNTHVVGSFKYVNVLASPDELDVPFAASCKGLKVILQAIIDKLCALDTTNVKMGFTFNLCRITAGVKEIVTITDDVLLADYLDEQAIALCGIVDFILGVSGVTCDQIKTLHPLRPATPIGAGDGLYMIKSGLCSLVSPKEIAIYIFKLAKTDADVKAAFCGVDCAIPAAGCPDITNFVATPGVDTGVPDVIISAVTFSSVPLTNQFLTIKYKLFGAPTWTVATTTAQAYPNGNLITPYEIPGLTAGASYDVNVQITPSGDCSPLGVTKNVIAENPSETSIITFVNQFYNLGATITAIKFGAGANILSTPIANGDSFTYDYSALGAGPFVVKMAFGGVANPTKMNEKQLRGMSQVGSAYVNYTTGDVIMYAALNPLSGDVIVMRDAVAHKFAINYIIGEGFVNSACRLPLYTVSRNADAVADAIATTETITAALQFNADNFGVDSSETAVFAPTDISVTGNTGDIGTGVCSSIIGSITGIS